MSDEPLTSNPVSRWRQFVEAGGEAGAAAEVYEAEIERLTAELAEANGDIDHSIENGQKLRAEIAALRSTLRACRALRQLDEELAALIEPALAGAADEIERLTARVIELEDAMREIAERAGNGRPRRIAREMLTRAADSADEGR